MTSFFNRLTYSDVAKTIDHSLLKPELDDASTSDVAAEPQRPFVGQVVNAEFDGG